MGRKKRPSISLCMITKDEEQYLAQALSSIKELVSEIIVVDTGSQDRTVEIAREFGAKVFDFEWIDDFSAARNFSLEKASGDWILVLDADEVIDQRDHKQIRKLIRKRNTCYILTQRHYMNNPRISNFTVCRGEYPRWERDYGGFSESNLCRLFPNHQQIHYSGFVHELVEHSIEPKKHLSLRLAKLPIHHFGHTEEISRQDRKANLYAKLGEKKAELGGPDQGKSYFELGTAYVATEKWSEARNAFEQAHVHKPEDIPTLKNLGFVLAQLGEHALGIDALNKALALDHESAECHLNISVLHIELKRWPFAEAHLQRAIELRPDYVNAYCNLGLAYTKMNRVEEALETLFHALDIQPNCLNAKLDVVKAYLTGRRAPEALNYLHQVILDHPESERPTLMMQTLQNADKEIRKRIAFQAAQQSKE